MARMRMLKAEFFRHEKLSELPIVCRYVFAGLWTIADREGRLEDRPRRIKADLFPFEDDPGLALALDQLEAAGFIVRYKAPRPSGPSGPSHGDARDTQDLMDLIWIPKFLAHQRPHPREAKSQLPSIDKRVDQPKANPRQTQGAPKDTPRLPVPVPVPVPVTVRKDLAGADAPHDDALSGSTKPHPKPRAPSFAVAFVDRLQAKRLEKLPDALPSPVRPQQANKLLASGTRLGQELRARGEAAFLAAFERFTADAWWRSKGCPVAGFLSDSQWPKYLGPATLAPEDEPNFDPDFYRKQELASLTPEERAEIEAEANHG